VDRYVRCHTDFELGRAQPTGWIWSSPETQEISMPHTYEYPRPALTVDCVVFGLGDEGLKVLLIRRDLEPFAGSWALPGGFVEMEETLEEAAGRELEEEAGLTGVLLEQLYTFGDVKRDPRDRVVSVAYYALVNIRDHRIRAATDARSAGWFPLADLPPLAFDHDKILDTARERLKGRLRYHPLSFELLSARFTLLQLQQLYEAILERPLDEQDFRRKVLATDLLVETGEIQQDAAGRSARLYRFDQRACRRLAERGFLFEI
jgi:8-oxo-dGTP diphosphatase